MSHCKAGSSFIVFVVDDICLAQQTHNMYFLHLLLGHLVFALLWYSELDDLLSTRNRKLNPYD